MINPSLIGYQKFETLYQYWLPPSSPPRIEAAKGDGTKYLGKKPSFSREALTLVQDMVATGARTTQIANAVKLTRQTVLRIKGDPEAAIENTEPEVGFRDRR